MNGSVSRLSLVQTEHYSVRAKLPYSPEVEKLYQDDAVWIITSSFIIFTMHSGFGLLESGSVAAKDEVNIMVKNVVDVVFGGLAYWAFGYGFSFGDSAYSNTIFGWGKFFYNPHRNIRSPREEGWAYANFLFQLSFATTASTIVSGAVAERAKLKSYILLGCAVILIQALPAHWVWDNHGLFFQLGVVDFAGCSCVHMVGGIIGLMATIYLKPRRNRFSENSVHQMSSPTNALLGTFMLWWGWFGINSGSAWGITDGRWRLGARASVATIMSSIGGGATSIIYSFIKTKKLQVNYLIYGLLSSVVSITAICAIARPWHALLIGAIGSSISISVLPALEYLKIDDPVGIVPVHLTSSIWGMFAVGIFAEDDQLLAVTSGQYGLIYSGNFKLLAVQMLCSVTILVYSAILGLAVLITLGRSPLGLRVSDYEEQLGADVVQHGLAGTNIARYHIEKPLTSKTFATVTKAITKWKLQTRAHRALRQQQTALADRRTPDGRAGLTRRHTTKISNGTIISSTAVTSAEKPVVSSKSHSQPLIVAEMTNSPARKLQGRTSDATVFEQRRDLVKCTAIDETASTFEKQMREVEKDLNHNTPGNPHAVPSPDCSANVSSISLNQRIFTGDRKPVVQEQARAIRRSLEIDQGKLQHAASADSGSGPRIGTASFRNKILPLPPDTV